MRTSKKASSMRQAIQAIRHYHAGHLDCALTLAGAAEGMLRDTNDRHLFGYLQPSHHSVELDLNFVRNWLKHPGGRDEAEIDQFEAASMIARAITKFIAVHH